MLKCDDPPFHLNLYQRAEKHPQQKENQKCFTDPLEEITFNTACMQNRNGPGLTYAPAQTMSKNFKLLKQKKMLGHHKECQIYLHCPVGLYITCVCNIDLLYTIGNPQLHTSPHFFFHL